MDSLQTIGLTLLVIIFVIAIVALVSRVIRGPIRKP